MPERLSSYFSRAYKWYSSSPDRQYQGRNGLETYDEAAQMLTGRKEFAQNLARQIGPSAGRVLELAAGTGLISQVLDQNFEQVSYMDLSSDALKMLKTRVDTEGRLVQANFLSLPFSGNAFDTLVCVGGYRYVSERGKNAFWSEAERVLRPDGRLFVAQFYPRFFSINGNDIRRDLENESKFKCIKVQVYKPRIPSTPLITGKYLSYEFINEKANDI